MVETRGRSGEKELARWNLDEGIASADSHIIRGEAFTHLPLQGQRLIAMLIADPPVPYAEISARLGIPIGSIGPTRSRCLGAYSLSALLRLSPVDCPAAAWHNSVHISTAQGEHFLRMPENPRQGNGSSILIPG